jgi:hypothetical protein
MDGGIVSTARLGTNLSVLIRKRVPEIALLEVSITKKKESLPMVTWSILNCSKTTGEMDQEFIF